MTNLFCFHYCLCLFDSNLAWRLIWLWRLLSVKMQSGSWKFSSTTCKKQKMRVCPRYESTVFLLSYEISSLKFFFFIPLKKFTIHITCYFTYKYFTILPELCHEEQKTMTTPWRLKEKLKPSTILQSYYYAKRETKGKLYFERLGGGCMHMVRFLKYISQIDQLSGWIIMSIRV